jgi:GDP-L-fucose synthase
VGGILANMKYPVDFLLNNIKIQNNIITACHKYGVKNLIFIGSSCIYPKNINRKIKETDILTGELEKTNEAYAIAKICGVKLIQSINQQYKKYKNFKILMPCNLYGPNDNYHAKNSHVLAALIRKFSTAKKKKLKNITIWGTGKPRREFMYVDNFAKAAIFFMKKKINNRKNENYLINIGCGDDLTIKELVIKLSKIFNYKGKITFDNKKPDGVKRKLLNINKSRMLGWKFKENFDYELKKHINKENFSEKNFT